MNPILNTAFKAARKAGDMMIRASANLDAVKVDSKAFNDFVSDIDRQSESILLDTLFYSYPTHLVRSEEGGYFRASKTREGVTIEQVDAADVPAVPEYEWIIDPLDGTTNYLHGHPQYAISMALLHKGKLQEALVYAPERNDCYMASRGQGALRNDRRIRVSNRIELNRCLIGTGFPVVDQSMMDTYLAILKDFLAKTAGGRREGAAALDLCALACGRLDGFFEFNLKPWDIAAGALIVQEAGGIVTDMQGNESWLESGDVVAANPKVLAQMLQIIAPHIK
ncbi:inositol monophosphatase [Uruburuella suis]|uniref:Inositol-1-monophosphatase n=1 Tax=Uruburuella suis TaxID=252130 RepID=A0AAE9KH17_9NEIS|nr:inositol monophosphatase family protein [Uruburuella suis]TCP10444.1 myo-inositol-1(or 4)-monophosphatase [Uruburuella suis]UOO78437.1 inositol monophosphatase [Uruburuella suis]